MTVQIFFFSNACKDFLFLSKNETCVWPGSGTGKERLNVGFTLSHFQPGFVDQRWRNRWRKHNVMLEDLLHISWHGGRMESYKPVKPALSSKGHFLGLVFVFQPRRNCSTCLIKLSWFYQVNPAVTPDEICWNTLSRSVYLNI